MGTVRRARGPVGLGSGRLSAWLRVSGSRSASSDSATRPIASQSWTESVRYPRAINEHWIAAFPDPTSRPARHTLQNDHLPAKMLVQCDVIAVITDEG